MPALKHTELKTLEDAWTTRMAPGMSWISLIERFGYTLSADYHALRTVLDITVFESVRNFG